LRFIESYTTGLLFRSDETCVAVRDSATLLKHPPLGSIYGDFLNCAASAGVLAQASVEGDHMLVPTCIAADLKWVRCFYQVYSDYAPEHNTLRKT
jgi:hypothetical protein